MKTEKQLLFTLIEFYYLVIVVSGQLGNFNAFYPASIVVASNKKNQLISNWSLDVRIFARELLTSRRKLHRTSVTEVNRLKQI